MSSVGAEPPRFSRLTDYVYHWARHRPEHEALVIDDSRTRYRDLGTRVTELSKALLAAGVRRGDRIAMLVSSRPEFFEAMLASVAIGAIWLGLHPRYKLPEFRHVLAESTPKLLLAFSRIDGRDYRSDLETLNSEFGCIERVICYEGHVDGGIGVDDFVAMGAQVSDAELHWHRDRVEAADSAVIIFTSGSTGSPKGALISHAGLIGGGLTQSRHWPSKAMRLLQTMPPNHIACIGMSTAHALMCGSTIVFMDQFSPARLLDVVEGEKITFLPHAPAVFNLLVNEPDFDQRDLSSIEYLIWAGAPMMSKLIKRLEGLGAHLGTAFGMTELGAYVCFSDHDAPFSTLAGTIGRPDASYELQLGDMRGDKVPRGQEGEIQARGAWLMNGYFNHPELTRDAYTSDGWFRSGDVAVEGEDGNWTLVGRTKEMFKSGGYNIYPREVEIVIESHPQVEMAAVIGVADELWHEVGHAFVQPDSGANIDEATLLAWCSRQLANYKVPKRIEIVEELPRLPIGKIDKQSLKRRLSGADTAGRRS